MDLTASFILLAVFILLYSGIIEVFTILFRLTGLTAEKARTQVISLLTNSGFTTSESEIILSSRKRRTLAQLTMLFGYSFTVIIVSVIVNFFLSMSQTELTDLLPKAAVLFCGGLALFWGLHTPPVRSRLDHLIERVGNRIMFGRRSNPVVLMDLYGTNAIVEVFLEHVPPFLSGVRLSQSGLREQLDIHVLHINCGTVNRKLDGDTILCPGDVVLVFGSYKNIRKTFERPAPLAQPHG